MNGQFRTPVADNFDSDDEIEAFLFDEPRRRHHPLHDHPFKYNRNQNSTDYKIKINLPHFDGHLHIKDFLDWMHNVDNFLDYMSITEAQQVK